MHDLDPTLPGSVPAHLTGGPYWSAYQAMWNLACGADGQDPALGDAVRFTPGNPYLEPLYVAFGQWLRAVDADRRRRQVAPLEARILIARGQ